VAGASAAFRAAPRADWRLTVDEVSHLPADNVLVDARAPDRFHGRNETLDKVGGHIPGARNHFFQQNLTADKRFKSPAELRAQWDTVLEGRPARDVVMYCGSGVTACHNLLSMEVAGLSGARIFPGSWSEWSSDASRPVETESSD
jgi:thiosulfate/3-mercaptopyruvate sulfurtransferase